MQLWLNKQLQVKKDEAFAKKVCVVCVVCCVLCVVCVLYKQLQVNKDVCVVCCVLCVVCCVCVCVVCMVEQTTTSEEG